MSLADQHCEACSGALPAIKPDIARKQMENLDPAWRLSEDSKTLTRDFKLKGFAKATYLANLCAWLADQEGHHPDICFGYGYVSVSLTTHEIDGLSGNDFIWAAKLDALVG